MNIKARFVGFKAWAGARADIDRITSIWRECLDAYGGPYLFGQRACAADAMYAPVCSHFVIYDVVLDEDAAIYSYTLAL
jgi:glutathione S-transferase